MNKTTGDVATALSIAALVSVDSRRALMIEGTWKTGARGCKKVPGRESGRNAFRGRIRCKFESFETLR